MKEPPLRTTCGGGSFVLRSVREGQPSDPVTTTSSDCVAEWMTWLWGPFVPVAVSRLCRERRVTLGMDGGRGCCNALSLCFFAPLARNAQHLGKCIDVWTGLDCGFKWLERYGCEREIVIGVILFHKLIETKRHVDWNVQNLALFAEILVA